MLNMFLITNRHDIERVTQRLLIANAAAHLQAVGQHADDVFAGAAAALQHVFSSILQCQCSCRCVSR